MLKPMLVGAIMLNAWAISLFFLRFWKRTRDRLFGWFAVAFLLMGIERIISAATLPGEAHFHVFLLRLAAFLMIIFAILDKNRRSSKV